MIRGDIAMQVAVVHCADAAVVGRAGRRVLPEVVEYRGAGRESASWV